MKDLQQIFDELYKQQNSNQQKTIVAKGVVFSHKELRKMKDKNIIIK